MVTSKVRENFGIGAYFVTSGFQAADVELAIERVEADLAALHIRVVQRPGYSTALGVDEKQLETLLRNNINYLQDAAMQHDLDCLTAVYRWRDGEPQARLETCMSVFVTNNTALIRAARTFFGDDEPEGSWPPAILDDDLGTLSWLKNPLGAPDFPRSQIIADAYAALPDGSVMLTLSSLGEPLLLDRLALALYGPTHSASAHLPLLLIASRRLQRTPPTGEAGLGAPEDEFTLKEGRRKA